jgi:hypothetical protein
VASLCWTSSPSFQRRDAIASRLMRYHDQNGQDWADIIEFLTMWPDARRQVVRILAEIGAGGG